MELEITIEYNGKYPNLCAGNLIININKQKWEFGEYCLKSGGCCSYNPKNSNITLKEGPWKINEWPEGFPEKYKDLIIVEINKKIKPGCCGGCS